MTWTFNGKEDLPKNAREKMKSVDNWLTISNVQLEHSGVYGCFVKYEDDIIFKEQASLEVHGMI